MADHGSPSRIMSKRIGRERVAFRFRGGPAHRMPLSVRMARTRQDEPPGGAGRGTSRAVRLSAFSADRATADLRVRSMPTTGWSLPAAVCISAMSM